MPRGYVSVNLGHVIDAESKATRGDATLQIHFHESGSGTPLVLLHPSPLSFNALSMQIDTLSPQFRCLAWDAPGYGGSDPLPAAALAVPSLTPYVDALHGFIDALGLRAPLIYGSATGAQIAIEFARRHPGRCRGLLLDNAALFTEAECAALMQDYFPDLNPQADGSHLQTLWDMVRASTWRFPWCAEGDAAKRRQSPAAPEIIQQVVVDYLRAGAHWDHAYRAAFANERPEALLALQVPTHILLWEDGLLGPWGERVAALSLPPYVRLARAGTGIAARLERLTESAQALANETVSAES